MAFDDVISAMQGDYFGLDDDGDSAAIVFLAEPVAQVDNYNGKERTRALFPIFTQDGLKVWAVGRKLTKTIKSNWDKLNGQTVTVLRVGRSGDPNTVYSFRACDDEPDWRVNHDLPTEGHVAALMGRLCGSIASAATDEGFIA